MAARASTPRSGRAGIARSACSPAIAGSSLRSGPTSAPASIWSTLRAAGWRPSIEPQRAGQVFTGFTDGEVQYDYDVTFWQASPYAQADISLPGRVQLSAGARYDHIGYDYDNHLSALATGSHRRPASTGVTFDRISPKLGATWELAPNANLFALLPRGVPCAVGEPAVPPGIGGEHGRSEAGPGQELGGRLPHGAGGRGHGRGHRLQHATAGRHPDVLRSGQRPPAHPECRRHQPSRRRAGAWASALARGLRLDGAVSYAKHSYVEWTPRPGVDYSGNEMELAPAPHRQQPAELPARRSSRAASSRWNGSGSAPTGWIPRTPTSTTATTCSTSTPRCR